MAKGKPDIGVTWFAPGAAALAALLTVVLLLLSILLPPAVARASGGHLDHSFSRNGKVLTRFGRLGRGAYSVAVGPRGRIVIAGGASQGFFGLLRYKPNGRLDHSFGHKGRVETRFGNAPTRHTYAHSVVIDPRGGIVAAGGDARPGIDHSTHFALARYKPNGHRDRSFSDDGRVTTNFIAGGAVEESVNSVAIDGKGRIVAAGDSCAGGYQCDFALARYKRHGHLDRSFSDNGKVITDLGVAGSGARSVAIDTRGRIVAAGTSCDAYGCYFALSRYKPNGSLDASFGTGGTVATGVPGYANALALDSRGRIVAAGSADSGPNPDFAIVRYKPNGGLDDSFGTGGEVTMGFRGFNSGANSIAIDSRGRIVALGETGLNPSKDRFALARYKPNGERDQSFSGNGKATTDFSGWRARGRAVAIDSRDRIVAAGLANHRYALARYIGYHRR